MDAYRTPAERSEARTITERWTRRLLLTAVAILAGLALGYAKHLKTPFAAAIENGGLAGPDAYARLLRVEHLLQTGRWYQPVLPDLNAPLGMESHWTRLLDALIAPMALGIAALGTDERMAVLTAGKLVSPLLLGLTLLVLCRALRPYTSAAALLLVPVMLFLSHQAAFQFMWARPDHHALLLFLFVVSFVFAARAIDKSSTPRSAYLAGVASTIGLWVSVEALVTQVCLLSVFSLLWVVTGNTRFAQMLLRFSIAAFVTSLPVLALERPIDDWLELSYHRISLVHVTFLLLVALGAGTLRFLSPIFTRTMSSRLISSGIIFSLVILAQIGLFPDFFVPQSDLVDPVVKEVLFENNSEWLPLFSLDLFMNGSLIGNLSSGLIMILLIGLSFHKSSTRTQHLMLLLVILALIYIILALIAGLRWAPYVQLLAIPPTVYFIDRVLRGRISPLAWQFSAILLVLGPTLLAVLIVVINTVVLNYDVKKLVGDGCPWYRSGELFDEVPAAIESSSIILSNVFAGPEIAWFTGLRVVAGPYHVEASPIIDTQKALLSADFRAMREVVGRRGIDYVLVCTSKGGQAPRNSIYERLRVGNDLPPWLRLLRPENGEQIDLKLYEIVHREVCPLQVPLCDTPLRADEIPSKAQDDQ